MSIKLGLRDNGRNMVYYHRFMQLFINHFIPNANTRFGRQHCVPSYIQQKRIFSDISKKDNEKNSDELPAMHYPNHVQVLLRTHLPTLYNSSFFGGEMIQEPHLVEDLPVSTQVTTNLIVSETSLEPILEPQPVVSKKPTSGVSQKAPVVRKRRYVVTTSSSGSSSEDDDIPLAEREDLKAAIQLSKLGQRGEGPSRSQAAVSQKTVVLKKGK
jgi:hypothetical protein